MTYEERQQLERKRIVEIGLAKGWLRFSPPVSEKVLFSGNNKRVVNTAPKRTKAQSYEGQFKRRAQFIAQGLNCFGEKRRKQQRPELKGLIGNDYQREYMRLWRKEKSK